MEKYVVMYNVYGREGVGSDSVCPVDGRWSLNHIIEWAKANKDLQGRNGEFYSFRVFYGNLIQGDYVTDQIVFDGKQFKALMCGRVEGYGKYHYWYLSAEIMNKDKIREFPLPHWRDESFTCDTKAEMRKALKRYGVSKELIKEFNKYGKIVIA